MLDMELINNTISELENDSDTNFNNCQKLASLYLIRQHYKPVSDLTGESVSEKVKKELADILPHYDTYCEVKAQYQLNKIGKEPMIQTFSSVCKEVKEFLTSLYIGTDTPEERQLLRDTLENLNLT